jgi:hypothetical protein
VNPHGPSRRPDTGGKSKWEERPVDRQQPHFVVSHGPIGDASAVIASALVSGGVFGSADAQQLLKDGEFS